MGDSITYILFGNANPLIKAFAAAYGTIKGINSAIGALTEPLTGAAGGLGGLLKTAISGAADMESVQMAFESMTGSIGSAVRLLDDLKKFAADTPFEFPEIAAAGKQLLAFGSAASGVKDELRVLGDIGALMHVPIGELAELYGKARVQGRLYMEDVNQFTGRGIAVIQEFAKQLNVSTEEVKGLIEAGAIGFPQVDKALRAMTAQGGRFFEGMKKQSTTANGLWSTLQDNVKEVLREFGKPLLPELKKILTSAIDLTGQLTAKAREWGQAVATTMGTIRELFVGGALTQVLSLSLQIAFGEAITFFTDGMINAIGEVANICFEMIGEAVLRAGAGLAGAMGRAMTGGAPPPDDPEQTSESLKDRIRDRMGVEKLKADLTGIVGPAMAKVLAEQAANAKKLSDAMNAPETQSVPDSQKKAAGVGKGAIAKPIEGDRLAKIGLTIGPGGPAGAKHLADTARATAESAKALQTLVAQGRARTAVAATL